MHLKACYIICKSRMFHGVEIRICCWLQSLQLHVEAFGYQS